MPPTWFSQPVSVYWGGGVTHVVSSWERAGDLLLDPKWPKRGRKYKAAVIAILEGGATDIDAAEKAFRVAAKEAGILLEDR